MIPAKLPVEKFGIESVLIKMMLKTEDLRRVSFLNAVSRKVCVQLIKMMLKTEDLRRVSFLNAVSRKVWDRIRSTHQNDAQFRNDTHPTF